MATLHLPCSFHDCRYTSLQLWQPPYDFDHLAASAFAPTTQLLFVKLSIRLKNRYLYVSADGARRVRRAAPTVNKEEGVFRLSTFSFATASRKLSEMLHCLCPSHLYPDAREVIPKVYEHGVQIADRRSNNKRRVLPLFVELEGMIMHVIDERRPSVLGVIEDGTIPEGDESDGPRMVPASQLAVKKLLKRVRAGEEEEEEEEEEEGRGWKRRCRKDGNCAICMEELEGEGSSGEVVNMPCSHVFHEECLKQWLGRSHSCPLCRYQMPTSS